MGAELGRISGPLLAADLRRDQDLTFKNTDSSDPLLHLLVEGGKLVGINTVPATGKDLHVNSETRTTALVTDVADIGNFHIATNRIQHQADGIYLTPNALLDPTVTTTRIGTANLHISNGLIENIINNSHVELTPNGTGEVKFTTSKVNVSGSLEVAGNITFNGDVTLGTDSSDNVEFGADINSNIIPNVDIAYDLGSVSQQWKTVYATNFNVSDELTTYDVSLSTLTVDRNTFFRSTASFGNTNGDVITINALIDNSLIPTTSSSTIGSLTGPKIWDTLFTTHLNVDSVLDIQSNTITTIDFSILDGGSSGLTGAPLDGGSSLLTGPMLDGGDASFSASSDLKLVAAGTGIIHVTTTDVEITNNLTVNTDSILSNVDIIGTLALPSGYLYQHIGNTDRTGNTNITGSLTVNGANTTQFEDIKIYDNVITTTVGNNNLQFTANGTGIVDFLSPVDITHDLDVLSTGYFNAINVDTSASAVELTAGDVYITSNYITTTGINENLQVGANGTGRVYVPTANVDITNDLTVVNNVHVDGTTTLLVTELEDLHIVGNITQTGNTYITGTFTNNNITILAPSYIEVPDVRIQDNSIIATALDNDLNFSANGIGGVIFDRRLKITDNVISNIFDTNDIDLAYDNLFVAEDLQLLITEDGDYYLADVKSDRDLSIIFEPSNNSNVVIDSTKAIAIAYGNNTNRVLDAVGEIRQNSTTNVYEGYTPTGLVSFTNLYDSDSNTYITPELTPGANDNILRFGVDGVVKATISSTALYSNSVHVDNVSFADNIIKTVIDSSDLTIAPNGTGNVLMNDIGFKNNAIINNTNDALILEGTGGGYVKFAGTGGVVFPSGDTSERRSTPDLGEYRYNTELGYSEIFDGSNWVAVSGSANQATPEEVAAETDLWAIILG